MRVFQVLRSFWVYQDILYTLQTRSLIRPPKRVAFRYDTGSLLCVWPIPHASKETDVYVDICGIAHSEHDFFERIRHNVLCEIERISHIRKLPRP